MLNNKCTGHPMEGRGCDSNEPLIMQHTVGHRNCPLCNKTMDIKPVTFSLKMTFAEAFDAWLAGRVIDDSRGTTRVRYISPRTERDLRQYARAVALFLGDLPLGEIHAGHLREYQRMRATNPDDASGRWRCVTRRSIAGPFASRAEAQEYAKAREGCLLRQTVWEQAAAANLIRKEVQTIMRVLKAAGAWSQHFEEHVEVVQREDSDVPRAMSPQEQHTWLHAAASRPEWRIVYWWSIVALQTTMSTNEMRAMRIGDVSLDQGCVQVRTEGAKNKFRVRTIPLQSPESVWALSSLIDRARLLGAQGLHSYLFPRHITRDRYDALRPMSAWGLRKVWDQVRAASGLRWLRPYDLRHTAITRMAEAGTPIQVIMAFAGHMSPRMQQHYTTISMESKRRWAAAAWSSASMPNASELPQAQPKGHGRWVWQPEQLAAAG